MEDGVEFSARTVDDAIERAESELEARRDDLVIDVISQGRSGVFGIGSEPARIVVRRRGAAPTETQTERIPNRSEAGSREDSSSAEEEFGAESDSGPSRNGANLAVEAQDVLSRLLGSMGIDAEVHVRSEEEPITLAVNGDNLGVLIGRRGDNLAALQFMVNLILSKNRRQWPRIIVDVENYRARREESLRSLADRIAYRVRRNYKPFTLEAMPASDRRIIHLSLRDRTDIETYSIGEGPARRVVIAPKRPTRSTDVDES